MLEFRNPCFKCHIKSETVLKRQICWCLDFLFQSLKQSRWRKCKEFELPSHLLWNDVWASGQLEAEASYGLNKGSLPSQMRAGPTTASSRSEYGLVLAKDIALQAGSPNRDSVPYGKCLGCEESDCVCWSCCLPPDWPGGYVSNPSCVWALPHNCSPLKCTYQHLLLLWCCVW